MRIVEKAGFSRWVALVALVPVLDVIMFLVFAFGDWPSVPESAGTDDSSWIPEPVLGRRTRGSGHHLS